MKILDRYVILSFLRNYLISFLVLVGMYVVLDMMFNIDELAEVREKGIRPFGERDGHGRPASSHHLRGSSLGRL